MTTTDKKPSKPKPNGKPKLTKPDDVTKTTSTAPHSNGTTSKPNGKPKLTKKDDVTTTTTTAPPHSNGTSSEPKADDVITDSVLYNIPMNRVSRIIKSEDPNIRITQEALFVVNKASEKFLQLFTTEAYASAFLDRKKQIDYKHLSSVVGKRKRFDFLADFVPEKVKAEDALKEVPTDQ